MRVQFKVKRVIVIAFMLMASIAWLSCSDWEAVKVVKQPSPTDSTEDSLPSCEEIDISGSMQGVDFFKLFAGKKNIVFMDGDDTIGMVLNMGENTHYIYKENELDIKTVTYTSKDNMGVVVVTAKNAIITAYTPKLEGVYIAMFNKSNNKDADKIKEKRDVSGTEEEKLYLSGYWFNGDNTVFKVKPKANAKFSPCKETNTSSVSTPSLLDMVYTSPGTDPNISSAGSVSSSPSTSSDDASSSGGYVPSWGTKRWVQNEDQNRMMEVLLGVSNDYIALSQDADLTSYPSGVVNGQLYCYTNPSNGVKKVYIVSEMMYEFLGPHSWPGMNGTTKVGQVYVYDNTYTGSTDYFVARKRVNTDWFPTNQTTNGSWEYVASGFSLEYYELYNLLNGTKPYTRVAQGTTVSLVKDQIYLIEDTNLLYPQFWKASMSGTMRIPKKSTSTISGMRFLGPYVWPGVNERGVKNGIYVSFRKESGILYYYRLKKETNTDWYPNTEWYPNEKSNSSWEYVMTKKSEVVLKEEAKYTQLYELLTGKNKNYTPFPMAESFVDVVKDRIYQSWGNPTKPRGFYKARYTGRPFVESNSPSLNDFEFLGPYEWPGIKEVEGAPGVRNGIYVSYNEYTGRVDYFRLKTPTNLNYYPSDKGENSSWAYVGTDNSQFFTVDPTTSNIADYVLLKEKAEPRIPPVSGWYTEGVYYSWAQDRNGVWYRKYYKIVDVINYSSVYQFMGPMMLTDLTTTDFSPNLRGQVGSVFRRYNPSTKKAAYFKLRVSSITQSIPMDKSNNNTWEYIGEEDDINTITVKEYTVTNNYIAHEAGWSWNSFIATMESISATATMTFVRSVQTDWDISGGIDAKHPAFKQRLIATFTHPEPNTIYTLVCWSPPKSNALGLAERGTYRFDGLIYYLKSGDLAYPDNDFPCCTYRTIDVGYVTGAHEIGHVLGAVHTSTEYGEWVTKNIGAKGPGFRVYETYYDVMYPSGGNTKIRAVHKSDENISTIKRLLGITK